ncbi:restriction endonuclease [Cellulosilyticum lentocellum]|uniref:Restriction endonuclease n=1 Tax=Cellulosilyticum lentocellum (strain ATCC 49066 / DSM 5427 / NCIMB 11756 / RHM5) TaxID=642492 RepID=F2JRB9_CELLD|nr:restriction endonuclease [Cellulosilyticum lentocellum]ADZ82728.1 restriction endonuclease [Cellulosilyticum lentocellum DSM 5427]
MKYIFNGLIMLFSFYIALLIFKGEANTLTYFTLIFIEWVLMLIGKPFLRQSTFSRLYKKGSLGDERGPYGKIHMNSIEEDLNKVEAKDFDKLIADLYQTKGYEVECIPKSEQMGINLIARRRKEVVVICTKYRTEIDADSWKEAVQGVSENMKHYKANRGIVITNSKFNNYDIKEARPKHTQLIDYHLLVPLIKEGMLINLKNG